MLQFARLKRNEGIQQMDKDRTVSEQGNVMKSNGKYMIGTFHVQQEQGSEFLVCTQNLY